MLAPTTRRAFLGRATLALGATLAAPPWATPALAAADDHEWHPPWLPSSAGDIVVRRIGTGGLDIDGEGDPRKLLLLVAPDSPIQGPLDARHLRYAGVVLLGATFRAVGRHRVRSPTGRSLRGGHLMQISFNGDVSRSRRPYLWLANIDFDRTDSWWGDFLQVGTSTDAAGSNWRQWCDVYLQKILVRSGHYGWTAPGNNLVPHSDFIQTNLGGIRSLNVADVDIRWGYQTFFARPDLTRIAYPDGVFTFRRVLARPMPPSTYALGGDGVRLVRYLTMTREARDVSTGKYYAHRATDFHILPQAEVGRTWSRHFAAQGLTSANGSDWVTWNAVRARNRRYPVWTGTVRIGEPRWPFVTTRDVGAAHRVTSGSALLRRFG